jgi:hypothetical protein
LSILKKRRLIYNLVQNKIRNILLEDLINMTHHMVKEAITAVPKRELARAIVTSPVRMLTEFGRAKILLDCLPTKLPEGTHHERELAKRLDATRKTLQRFRDVSIKAEHSKKYRKAARALGWCAKAQEKIVALEGESNANMYILGTLYSARGDMLSKLAKAGHWEFTDKSAASYAKARDTFASIGLNGVANGAESARFDVLRSAGRLVAFSSSSRPNAEHGETRSLEL